MLVAVSPEFASGLVEVRVRGRQAAQADSTAGRTAIGQRCRPLLEAGHRSAGTRPRSTPGRPKDVTGSLPPVDR